jgi:hypothetical protein
MKPYCMDLDTSTLALCPLAFSLLGLKTIGNGAAPALLTPQGILRTLEPLV